MSVRRIRCKEKSMKNISINTKREYEDPFGAQPGKDPKINR